MVDLSMVAGENININYLDYLHVKAKLTKENFSKRKDEKNRIIISFLKGGSSIKKYCQNVRNRKLAS